MDGLTCGVTIPTGLGFPLPGDFLGEHLAGDRPWPGVPRAGEPLAGDVPLPGVPLLGELLAGDVPLLGVWLRVERAGGDPTPNIAAACSISESLSNNRPG